jgi:hypothetical protein
MRYGKTEWRYLYLNPMSWNRSNAYDSYPGSMKFEFRSGTNYTNRHVLSFLQIFQENTEITL